MIHQSCLPKLMAASAVVLGLTFATRAEDSPRWRGPEFNGIAPETGWLGKGSVALAGGTLLALSDRGELLLAQPTPDGFKPTTRAQILSSRCWTTPVLANGCICGGSASARLTVLLLSRSLPSLCL